MDQNAHIPTTEIEQDIADTEAEIFKMERELPAHKILADNGDRLSDMRYRANRDGIEDRKRFIEKLRAFWPSASLGKTILKEKPCS